MHRNGLHAGKMNITRDRLEFCLKIHLHDPKNVSAHPRHTHHIMMRLES